MPRPHITARRAHRGGWPAACIGALAGTLLLLGCETTRGPSRPAAPAPATPTAPSASSASPAAAPSPSRPGPRAEPTAPPAPACRPGFEVIGVLVITRNTVRVNGSPARNGQTICTDDEVTTDATGVGEVVVAGGSDSIHLSENTDPRFRWTAARCVSVYAFNRGAVNLKSSQHCMVLRTADVLLYQPRNSQTEYEVKGSGVGGLTLVKPYLGVAPVKLKPTQPDQVDRIGNVQQLQALATPEVAQLKPNQLYVYKADVLAMPVRPLVQRDIRSISVPRLQLPGASPTAPAAPATPPASPSTVPLRSSATMSIRPGAASVPAATTATPVIRPSTVIKPPTEITQPYPPAK